MNQYKRLTVLGRGSYGVASLVRKRAEDGQSGNKDLLRLYVSKEVDLHTMPQAVLQETENEVKILKSLSHVNIVAYFDTFVEDEVLHIIMEYADGGDLFSAVKRRRLGAQVFCETEALSILLQCGRALRHLHARHIVHRDLKSQNIFLTGDGAVKIGDFGIARVLAHTRAMLLTLIGTPSHLSPEVCDNRPYGTKADLWSLGVVFYEVLTLEPPFKAMSLAALVIKIVKGEPKPVPAEPYSDEVRGLVGQLLRKDAARRPSAARLLREPALRRVAALSALPTLVVERTSSGSLSEDETLTPNSFVAAGDTQSPRSPDGPGSVKGPRVHGKPQEEDASWACIALMPKADHEEGWLTEMDVLSQAVLLAGSPCLGLLPELPPPTGGARKSPSLADRRDREHQGRKTPENMEKSRLRRLQRSLSTGDGFSVSSLAPRSGEGPWMRPQDHGLHLKNVSRRSLEDHRFRPAPLVDAAMMTSPWEMTGPEASSALLVGRQLPAMKVSSLPPTPSDGCSARAVSLGVVRHRIALQPLAVRPFPGLQTPTGLRTPPALSPSEPCCPQGSPPELPTNPGPSKAGRVALNSQEQVPALMGSSSITLKAVAGAGFGAARHRRAMAQEPPLEEKEEELPFYPRLLGRRGPMDGCGLGGAKDKRLGPFGDGAAAEKPIFSLLLGSVEEAPGTSGK